MSEGKLIPEPKIMLIDFPEAVQERIAQLGYNVIFWNFW